MIYNESATVYLKKFNPCTMGEMPKNLHKYILDLVDIAEQASGHQLSFNSLYVTSTATPMYGEDIRDSIERKFSRDKKPASMTFYAKLKTSSKPLFGKRILSSTHRLFGEGVLQKAGFKKSASLKKDIHAFTVESGNYILVASINEVFDLVHGVCYGISFNFDCFEKEDKILEKIYSNESNNSIDESAFFKSIRFI